MSTLPIVLRASEKPKFNFLESTHDERPSSRVLHVGVVDTGGPRPRVRVIHRPRVYERSCLCRTWLYAPHDDARVCTRVKLCASASLAGYPPSGIVVCGPWYRGTPRKANLTISGKLDGRQATSGQSESTEMKRSLRSSWVPLFSAAVLSSCIGKRGHRYIRIRVALRRHV